MNNSKFFLMSIVLIALSGVLTFESCEKDKIETIALETVNVDMLETVDYGTKIFGLTFKTDLETYPITYLIRSETNISGNQVNIQLKDIQKDGHDDLNVATGPASCYINLGALGIGQYELHITKGLNVNSGTFSIAADRVIFSLPSTEGLTINHDTLKRIPFGTVWGYVGYQNTSNQGLANNFISGLDARGAEPIQLSPGYYGYFSISDSGQIIQPIDENYSYYKEFVRNFLGEAEALNEHIGYYNTEFYNEVDVIINWFWDGQ